MGNISEHFDLKEFACHDCGKVPSVSPKFRELLTGLELLRKMHYPTGLTIISGFRCPTQNAKVGGAHNSQHLYGLAADIKPVVLLKDMKFLRKFRGIGYDKSTGCVSHVDVGHNNSVTAPMVWRYDDR